MDSAALVNVSLLLLGIFALVVGPILAIYQVYVNVKESRPPYVEIRQDHVERVSREYPILRVLRDLMWALIVVGIGALVLATALERM